MKTALLLLLLLVCVTKADDDVPQAVQEVFLRLKSSLVERLSNLEGQHADMASRLSASETNMEEELQKHKADTASRLSVCDTKLEEFQTRLSQSEKLVEELQKHGADHSHYTQLQTSYDALTQNYTQLETSHDALTQNYTQLENSHDALTLEKNQLQREVNQLKNYLLKNQTAVKSCPSGWTKFGDSCYYRTTAFKTWQAGRQECLNQGADLVVINSGEEQVFLRGLNPGATLLSWIGLQRTGGTWTWLDGTPLTTQYWYTGYPDNDGDCGGYYHGRDPGTWFNGGCSVPRRAICEK